MQLVFHLDWFGAYLSLIWRVQLHIYSNVLWQMKFLQVDFNFMALNLVHMQQSFNGQLFQNTIYPFLDLLNILHLIQVESLVIFSLWIHNETHLICHLFFIYFQNHPVWPLFIIFNTILIKSSIPRVQCNVSILISIWT